MRIYLFFHVMLLLVFGCSQEPHDLLTPDQAISDFEMEDGFIVTCIASEPDIEDPVAIVFDDQARLWVVEMRGYMPDVNGKGEGLPTGRIKILEDIDKDGKYEKVSVFLDSLVLPRAVCPVYGGVLVAEPPYLWFYNSSGESRILVDSVYADGGNVEHQANGLLLGLDNWIYSAKSDRRYRMIQGRWVTEQTVFRGQWGIDQDDWGRLFYNHNSAVLLGDTWPPSFLPASATILNEKIRRVYGNEMIGNRVFPRIATPGVNRGYEQGVLDSEGKLVNVTAACGVSIYGGGLFPDAFNGNAFSPEPSAQLIKRVILVDHSGEISGKLPYENREFLTSTDERFRPVFTTTGPDGALYVVDMYRGLIQHSTYLTNYLRKHVLDRKLDSPFGMGRIYRIHYKDKFAETTSLADKKPEELLALLGHKNRWVRIRAQWAIVSSGKTELFAHLLQDFLIKSTDDISSIHALWSLEGLNILTDNEIMKAAESRDPIIRHLAIHLAGQMNAELFTKLRRPNDKTSEMVFVSTAPGFCKKDFNFAKILLASLALQYQKDSVMSALLAGAIWEHALSAQVKTLRHVFLKEGVSSESILLKYMSISPTENNNIDENLTHLNKAERDLYNEGNGNYKNFCSGCHGKQGEGIDQIAPPVRQSDWVNHENINIPISIILNGMKGPIWVSGKAYDFAGPMPGLRDNQAMNDGTIAKILTFLRNTWGSKGTAVHTEEVTEVRVSPPMNLPSRLSDSQLPERKSKLSSKSSGILDSLIVKGKSSPAFKEDHLLNIKNPDSWHKVGGKAIYRFSNGSIIGTSVLGSPNTFLVTNGAYADFILDAEVRIDNDLNSGIQIRSNDYPTYLGGVFHGYQIEIDPSRRAWSGGLYDEGRRGWLQDLKGRPELQKAFRPGEWNHFRIQAKGSHLQSWINQILVADFKDSLTLSGHIGLQVHDIGNDSSKAGKEVHWRNIRIKDLGGYLWFASEESPDNYLFAAIDGKDSTYWRGRLLTIDGRQNKPWEITSVSKKPVKVQWSSDGVQWKSKLINKFSHRIRWARYIRLSDPGNKDMVIYNLSLE
ncbi:MAG: DUF1080 domain-containing protein [Saprospiraceae bacterium]|nr:DUF1080 domain-containing protein [Saprospiraceae bacterium]